MPAIARWSRSSVCSCPPRCSAPFSAAMSNAGSSGSGPSPASSASSASRVYSPTRTWRRVARSETTSSAAVLEWHGRARACRGAWHPGSTNARRPFVIRWTTSVVPSSASKSMRFARRRACRKRLPDEARERRLVRLADREVHEHGRADRERARPADRAPARGPPARAAQASGTQYPGNCDTPRAATCNGARSRRTQIPPDFGAAEHLSAHSRAISGPFVATYVPTRVFSLTRGPTLGTIAHHTTAQMSRGRASRAGIREGRGQRGQRGVWPLHARGQRKGAGVEGCEC